MQGKKVLIGLCAGIACYKTIELIRLLTKQGAIVQVVTTPKALKFVTELSLQAISGNKVRFDLFDLDAEQAMGHIELARWADLIVIAPSSADFISRLNLALADDLLTTICLATNKPIMLAPAMNQQMFANSTVQKHLQDLRNKNIHTIGPNSGLQACGDEGLGRMSEPSEIFDAIENFFNQKIELQNLSILLTAGPTIENIDPVRFISNYSSGKMGYALAKAFADQGAKVTLISGPCEISRPHNVEIIKVKTALEMHQAVLKLANKKDIFVATAAVADFRVDEISTHKIKKQPDQNELILKLVKNPDIVKEIANLQENRPFVVGFCAESENLIENAQKKLTNKNLDLICANDISNGKVFGSDLNELNLIWQDGQMILPTNTKQTLAKDLVKQIIKLYKNAKHRI